MRQGVGSAISIMGARPTSNNFMLDGTANIDTSLGTVAAVLSIDAIQEFKEQTSTYSAEYGFSSNQINIISKSGTNAIHGSAFDFIRNEKLDARNFFDPQDAAKPKLDQKQPGFVVGGPIFQATRRSSCVNYEGVRIERGFSSFYTVPTPDELAGHFSTTIIDPTTGQPFPNNTVPQSRYSRLAQLAVSQVRARAEHLGPQGNYQMSERCRRIRISSRSGSITISVATGRCSGGSRRPRSTTFRPAASATSATRPFEQDSTNWQLSHTWVVQSNLVNNFRFGRVKATANQGASIPADPADVTALGLTGVFTDLTDAQRAYPRINMNNYSQLGGGTNVYTTSYQPMWDLSDTMTWVKGITRSTPASTSGMDANRDLANEFLGAFTFSGDFTGNPVADMLLGYYSGAGAFQPAPFGVPGQSGNPREYNFKYFAPYIQDDWKVSSRLTLNLGLRWDYRTTPYETNNRMGWLDVDEPARRNVHRRPEPRRRRASSATAVSTAYCGRNNPKDPVAKSDFAPRLGFAWLPFGDGKTVVRGGYGIFYDSAEGREIDGSADIYPYVEPRQLPAIDRPAHSAPDDRFAVSRSSAIRAGHARRQQLHRRDHLGEPEGPVRAAVVARRAAVAHEQHDFELNYVGSKGTNLLMRRNIAQALALHAGSAERAGAQAVSRTSASTSTATGAAIPTTTRSMPSSSTGRAAPLVTLAYTWAKSTDSKSAAAGIGASGFNGWQGFLNNHDPQRDHGSRTSTWITVWSAASSTTCRSEKARSSRQTPTGVKNAVVGGWQVNGIYTWQRGFPITVTAQDLGGVLDTFGTNRADLVGRSRPVGFNPGINQWFNTAAFAQPALGQFGTVGRNTMRGPNTNNLDLALFKNFELAEEHEHQFRLESFNFFNHPQFNAPDTNVTSSRFGVIGSAKPGRINQLGLKFIF